MRDDDLGPAAPALVVSLRTAAEGSVAATVATVTPMDASTCRLRGGSDSIDAIPRQLALLGCEFSTASPPEPVEVVAGICERLSR